MHPKAINQNLLKQTASLRSAYFNASPFPHVVADNFLQEEFAQEVLKSFPKFDEKKAMNENGLIGGKAVHENLKTLGPSFQQLDEIFSSQDFLDWMGEITGIQNLLYDPEYFGGGTHENRTGQDMSLHVDFNFHPTRGWHRRVNALLYLNSEWDESWGGALELWKNPWDSPSQNEIVKVSPLWNRLVVFGTTEKSWHGFEPVQIPGSKAIDSRKSIAIYLYSLERPRSELGHMHSTVYYERPLPESIQPGKVLSQKDWAEVVRLTARRDDLIKSLYRREGQFNEMNANLYKQAVDQAEIIRRQQKAIQSLAGSNEEASKLDWDLLLQPAVSPGEHAIASALDQQYSIYCETLDRLNQPARENANILVEQIDQHTFQPLLPSNIPLLGTRSKIFIVPPAEAEVGKWAIVKMNAEEKHQLVYLAEKRNAQFVARQFTSPKVLLLAPNSLVAVVRSVTNDFGRPMVLPPLNEPLTPREKLTIGLFQQLHKIKNKLVGGKKSRVLWELSKIYRKCLRLFGVVVPVNLPDS